MSNGIEPHVGVDLRIHDGKARLTPRVHEQSTLRPEHSVTFDLPLIPATVIQWGGRLLRQVADGDHVILLLYLDMTDQQWTCWVPWQRSTWDGYQVDLGYARIPVPAPQLRLAGSIVSVDSREDEEAILEHLPIFDGVHFIYTPGSFLHLQGYLKVAGEPMAVSINSLISEPLSDEEEALLDRLHMPLRDSCQW